MQRMVIALDVDGTLFDGVEVAHHAARALRHARSDGHTLMIVTGRQWSTLDDVIPSIKALFDLAVCEEGAVMVDVATGEQRLLADPIDPALIAALRDAAIPDLDVGLAVVGAPVAFCPLVSDINERFGSRLSVVINKGSVTLAPKGYDKGTGLRAAIEVLHVEDLPILAIGDAANDLPMFAVATIPVGVANADDAVRASGVPLTAAAAGLGVAEALRRYLPRRPSV